MSTVDSYIEKMRLEQDELFAPIATELPADRSKLGSFFLQQLLERGDVYEVSGQPGHCVIRLAWGSIDFDCDLYADQSDTTTSVRVGLADALYDNLVPVAQHCLTSADFDALERAVGISGPSGFGSLLPKLRGLRAAVQKQRATLA